MLRRRLSQVVDTTLQGIDSADWNSVRHHNRVRGASDIARSSTRARAATHADGNVSVAVKTGRGGKEALAAGS